MVSGAHLAAAVSVVLDTRHVMLTYSIFLR